LTFDFDLGINGQNQKSQTLGFLFGLICLLYGANLSKIDRVVKDLSRNEIFDL